MNRFIALVKSSMAAIVIVAGFSGTSVSQAADDQDSSELILEEVIVTASQREQSLQTVPMSVSAITEQDLEQRGIDDIGEFFRTVPGIQYTDFGATGRRGERNLTIRGIVGVGAGGPLVGYYIDETPLPVSDPLLFDVNRIEVLRGPQGTLYGAGTAGGTIKVITNQPDSYEHAGKIDVSVSTTKSGGTNYDANGMINIPFIEEKLALRIVGYYSDSDGYIDSVIAPAGSPPEMIANSPAVAENNFNYVEKSGMRATLAWTPTDNLSITPMIYIHRAELGGESNHFPDLGDLEIVREVETPQSSDFDLYNLTVKYEPDNFSFVSATSYFESEYTGVEDLSNLSRGLVESILGLAAPDPTPFDLAVDREEFTQEFRLLSASDSNLQWTVGLFYQNRKLFDNSFVAATNITIPGTDIVVIPVLPFFGTDAKQETEEYAVFAEAYYDFTDQLKLTLGARWFDYTITSKIDSLGEFGTGPGETLTTKDDGIRPKVALSYQITDERMVYALASKGYRSGGVSDPVPDIPSCNEALNEAGLSEAPGGFDADSIWNYEVGFKTAWADRRVITNVTAFYIDWTNIGQALNLRQFGDGTCAFSPTVNAGAATSKGVELEAQWYPTDALNFGIAVAYTDATFGDDTVAGDAGDKLPKVPEWTVSLSGEYTFPLSNNKEAFIRLDYQYIDERIGEEQVLDSYDLANIRAGIYKDKWTVSLYVNNVTDSRPELGDRSFGSGFRRFTTLQPRTFGINLIKVF